jgi:hypothetical protein
VVADVQDGVILRQERVSLAVEDQLSLTHELVVESHI